jgi:hypothetical protein
MPTSTWYWCHSRFLSALSPCMFAVSSLMATSAHSLVKGDAEGSQRVSRALRRLSLQTPI